jgi:hypothetical protein
LRARCYFPISAFFVHTSPTPCFSLGGVMEKMRRPRTRGELGEAPRSFDFKAARHLAAAAILGALGAEPQAARQPGTAGAAGGIRF